MRINLLLRLWAVLDVLFSAKFKLITWDKTGRKTSETNLNQSKDELDIRNSG